ncbi:hypoxanthine-guanine phosphoribosyltransferase [Nitrosomonas sp. Is37]|uniref:hypoxanthine-guanine phosphoribosyltransferase n=1 Tax=Nitrosomonas sp. Is37 TaxID=3080535 RepID=UPI00294AFF5D|nr:hypoxanthine-guanine phosphoribosyltransferase [Nitrosomonas sp. Is37]MDV6343290.1 hypoxanthine-guanine phosphoribosyltransferase [Nitrosomonas sp. Is37]
MTDLTDKEAEQLLKNAELIASAHMLTETVERMAKEITTVLAGQYPLVLCVMSSAVVFTGQLLPLLNFPLDFDYLHPTRYNHTLQGGVIEWKVSPPDNLKGRAVLVLDDILDEGFTLATIRQRVMEGGAKAFYSAVLADKVIGKTKPICADFIGMSLPDRYVFGYGMDIKGLWRNLPAIFAIKE